MSDLDRLIQLRWLSSQRVLEIKEEQEYQSIYEKMKKAEKFFSDWYEESYSLRPTYQVLEQNQKTPEDIEKIKKYDDIMRYFPSSTEEYDLLENKEKEIQKLSEDNKQLKEELDKLQQSHDNYTKEVFNQHMIIQKLQQDSKTNAEIVEKIKDLLESWRLGHVRPDYNRFQSILKEIK